MKKATTFWPEYRAGCGLVDESDEMLKAIQNSNIPDKFKPAILAKVATYDSRERTTNYYIKETILRILERENRPMQVKDFIGEWRRWDGPLGYFTHQRVNAHMRQLVFAGLVKRSEVQTGRMIEVAPGKTVQERIVYFELV